MLSTIPFEIPAQLLSRLNAGELIRYGTILKDVATGRIAGHVQETGIAQSLLSAAMSGLPTPLSMVTDLVNMGSGIYTARQVAQVKRMVESLQALQIATLGVSLVGVGVTVAGFVYMHKRFNALDGRIHQVLEAVQRGFEEQRKADLRLQLARTRSFIDRAQHARQLNSPLPEYMNVAAGLAEQAAFFESEIVFVLSRDGLIDLQTFWQLTQTLILCNGLRIDCEIRTNELGHALAVTDSVAASYRHLFTPLTPVSFNCGIDEGMAAVKVLRDATDAAASKPYLIDYLRTRRISGEGYLNALEKESENPLMILREV
ncbi:hypothetical protein [Hydrogenophaga sp.]|uniref:hypothetical protein n=1 Tax=Hydrogenophaga sp. TaxID=1904254 RepID=UPI00271B53C1|nr:hypothetical protein [Hydrogenophaga sp.]MDO9436730.1 hypothetical protein [Hydrogenophaga sp.]